MLPTPSTLDHYFDISEPGDGYCEDTNIPLGTCTDLTGILLSGATVPLIGIDVNHAVMEWVFDADGSSSAAFGGRFTGQFAHNARGLQLIVSARKKDSTADENATLGMKAQIYWTNPGEAQQSLTTVASSGVIPFVSTTNTAANFANFTLDIGARLRAESKYIKEGAIFTIYLGPDAAVGTTNMTLQVAGISLRHRRHASLSDTSKRTA